MSNTKTITIDPVSRLEGKAKILLELDESTSVVNKAEFQVIEFRGFEKFLEGKMAYEIPRITPRICGICPVSHHLAGAKATDVLARAIIPLRASLTRELMHMGQFIHSHTLHVFLLALPDFIEPGFKEKSNDFLILLEKNPNMVKNVIKLRAFGQKLIETIGGKAIHPVSAIPGGISKPIEEEYRVKLLQEAKSLLEPTEQILSTAWNLLDSLPTEFKEYDQLETHYLGLRGPNKEIALYDGEAIILDEKGNEVESFRGAKYNTVIKEKSFSFSWAKFPYFASGNATDEQSIIQVGPLARQKIYDYIPTPKAQEFLKKFRTQFDRYTNEVFTIHYCRLIEIMYSLENAIAILENPDLMKDTEYRVISQIKEGNGVGIVEAPRGTLIHYYETFSNGRIKKADLVVPTTFNNPAINLSLLKVAKNQIKQESPVTEEKIRQIESTVRIFDPCLTCSTHSYNNFIIELQDQTGKKLKTWQ